MRSLLRPLLALLVLLSVVSCGFGKAVRSVVDVAADACELWAEKQQPATLQKLSPADFCAVADNVRPYVDQILAVQRYGATAGAEHCQ